MMEKQEQKNIGYNYITHIINITNVYYAVLAFLIYLLVDIFFPSDICLPLVVTY